MKKLILCADDFASGEAASVGIAELARQGRLSATSAMVLSPRWAQDALLLMDLRGRIDVGLHLDWTSEFAVAAGHGMALGTAMARAALGGFDRTRARAVIERQLDAFEARWQASPDHVDGHQHVQQFPGIREALLETIVARYKGARPYLRVSQLPPETGFKGRVISALGASALRRLADQLGVACAPAFAGVYDFSGDTSRYAALMGRWLQASPESTIIMCHPAAWAEPGDVIGQARAREFSYLGSADFGESLQRQRVVLCRGQRVL